MFPVTCFVAFASTLLVAFCSWVDSDPPLWLIKEFESLDEQQREFALVQGDKQAQRDELLKEAKANRSKDLPVTPAGSSLLLHEGAPKLLVKLGRQLKHAAAADDADNSLPFRHVDQQRIVPPGFLDAAAVAEFPISKAGDEAVIEALRTAGVVKLRQDVRPKRRCMETMVEVYQTALTADPSKIWPVWEENSRHQVLLSPEMPKTAAVLATVMPAVRAALEPILGKHTALVEFGAFVTNPGANAQHLHADLLPRNLKDHRQYAAFIALTHVPTPEDGAFHALQYSHFESPLREQLRNYRHHLQNHTSRRRRRRHDGEEDYRGNWSVFAGAMKPLTVDCGDVFLYDATVFHKGGPNFGNRSRGVIFLTFWGPGNGEELENNPILPELLQPPQGPFSIRRFEEVLMRHEEL